MQMYGMLKMSQNCSYIYERILLFLQFCSSRGGKIVIIEVLVAAVETLGLGGLEPVQ